MLSREYLYARRCVWELVQLFEALESRAAARGPLTIDESSAGLLMFWTILRGERTFLLRCLEGLGVDMWGLTCAVDELLHQRKADIPRNSPLATPVILDSCDALRPHARTWLNRAEQEASALGHRWTGIEHLLLAIIAGADPALSAVLQQQTLTHDRLRDALCEALANVSPQTDPPILATLVEEPRRRSLQSLLARPATGVARRFSMGMLLALTTTYAVLLGLMRALDFPGEWIVFWIVFFTGAGLGQPILFGGKNPRAASVWLGAVLFPLEVFLLNVFWILTTTDAYTPDEILAFTVFSILVGAPLGYLAGCLAAGVFVLADKYSKLVEKRRHSDEADEAPVDPFGNDEEKEEQPPSCEPSKDQAPPTEASNTPPDSLAKPGTNNHG